MADPDDLVQAALRDGAPEYADRDTLIAWYEALARRYADVADDEPGDSEARERAWNARAMARNVRRGRDW